MAVSVVLGTWCLSRWYLVLDVFITGTCLSRWYLLQAMYSFEDFLAGTWYLVSFLLVLNVFLGGTWYLMSSPLVLVAGNVQFWGLSGKSGSLILQQQQPLIWSHIDRQTWKPQGKETSNKFEPKKRLLLLKRTLGRKRCLYLPWMMNGDREYIPRIRFVRVWFGRYA